MNSAAQHNPSDPAVPGVAAIVLAAGLSSRMGCSKPLLPLAGNCALEHAVALFRMCSVHDVLVVLGHRAEALQSVVEHSGARWVLNERYRDGMYSSIIAAGAALPSSVQAAFVLPADVPLVRPATVLQMLAAFAPKRHAVLYPVFAGQRGHPPLIARSILDEAVQGASGPLSSLLERHAAASLDVPVFDEAIHADMDTPADYDALCMRARQRDIPSDSECTALLESHGVHAAIVRHANAVAAIAQALAGALTRSGIHLDVCLIRAGALLHDLAKGEKNHAAAGAVLLRALGFERVSEIVAAHTDLPDFDIVDERAVVFLADKLVRSDQHVSLDERFAPALHRFRDDPGALAAAQRRKQTALRVALEIERMIGASIENLLCEEVHS